MTDSGNFWTRSATRRSRIARSSRAFVSIPAMASSPSSAEGRGAQKPVGRALRTPTPIRAPRPRAMADRFFDFWRVDVFTDTPLTGNPLAVFPRATGLRPAEMTAIAREMNLSETTFVFPSTNPAAHYRNRIFTPGGEIPFAGHPSIGTAFVAALEGLVPHPDGSSVVYQELEIGVLPLELLCEDGQVKKVIMTQGEPVLGAKLKNLEPLAKALQVRSRDIGPKGLVPPGPVPVPRRREETGSGSAGAPESPLEVRREDRVLCVRPRGGGARSPRPRAGVRAGTRHRGSRDGERGGRVRCVPRGERQVARGDIRNRAGHRDPPRVADRSERRDGGACAESRAGRRAGRAADPGELASPGRARQRKFYVVARENPVPRCPPRSKSNSSSSSPRCSPSPRSFSDSFRSSGTSGSTRSPGGCSPPSWRSSSGSRSPRSSWFTSPSRIPPTSSRSSP